MSKISYKVIFNRKKKLNKDGKALIQIECYLNGKRKYLSSGIKIEPIYWNNKNSIVKKNHPQSTELNRIISKRIREIEDLEFKIFERSGSIALSDIAKSKNSACKSDDFLKFCFDNLESNTTLKISTKTQHRSVLRRLKKYNDQIYFSDLCYSFIEKYDSYLRDNQLHQNTIANQHKTIKSYINLAIKKKLLSADNYPYKNFKVKKIPTHRSFLTPEEVERISNLKFTDNTKHIERVKDMFVFSCYTGLRFSDVQNLKNKDITNTNGEYVVEIRQQKTDDFVKLPISLLFDGKAVDIIKKYQNSSDDDFVFTHISNQKANLKLKVVAILAKLKENLTFHIARHSFGTNLAAATSDQFLIKELMGHSDIKTSMIYIHITQEQIKNKLKNTKWD